MGRWRRGCSDDNPGATQGIPARLNRCPRASPTAVTQDAVWPRCSAAFATRIQLWSASHRDGMPVAVEVAGALQVPLEVVVVRELVVPEAPEHPIGALAEGDIVIIDDEAVKRLGLSTAQLGAMVGRGRQDLARRLARDYAARPRLAVAGRTVLLVDDGLVDTHRAQAAARWLRRRGASAHRARHAGRRPRVDPRTVRLGRRRGLRRKRRPVVDPILVQGFRTHLRRGGLRTVGRAHRRCHARGRDRGGDGPHTERRADGAVGRARPRRRGIRAWRRVHSTEPAQPKDRHAC